MTLIETLRSDSSNTTIAVAARHAADEMEEMVAEIKRLRAALKCITETSLDEWDFVSGVPRGMVHLVAQRALEQH